MIRIKLLLFIITSYLFFNLSGQTMPVDSLENLLQNHPKVDTVRVNLLNQLANASFSDDKKKAFDYANEAVRLSDSIGNIKGKSTSLYILGNYYKVIGEFENAIENYQKSANIDKKSGNNKPLINTLKSLGFCYSMVGNTSEGIEVFKEGLQISEEGDNITEIAEAFNNLGNVYQMTRDIDLAIDYYNKALVIWKEVGDKTKMANVYNNLGYLYMDQNQGYKALEAYFNALAIYKEMNNISRIAMVQNGLGAVYHGLHDVEKAREYFLQALKTNRELNNQKAIASCLCNLANIAKNESDFDNAIKYYNESYQIFSELGLKSEMADVLFNKNITYKETGEYDRSIEMNEKALKIYLAINDEKGEGACYIGFAITYFEMGRYKDSEYYGLKGLEIMNEYGQLDYQGSAHELLYEIYERNGDYSSSLLHHKQLMVINDSLFNEEKVRKISGLEHKYKFEKEKQTIEIEQQKKDALQAEEMRQQKFMRNAFIIGFLLVLCLAIVILRSYLQKQKANRKLVEKNNVILKQKKEKELLVKEIHHRVKNNLQIILGLFNLQMNNTENQETRSVLIDGLNRVKSVGLIHQLLYTSDEVINVELEDFVKKLLDHITSFATDKPTKQNISIPKGIRFDIDTTIPLGLIITELLTNAFKYAFNETETCVVTISLIKLDNDQYKLEVMDNGSGLPEKFNIGTSKSLGLRLVRNLSDQLSGQTLYEYDNGAKFTLTFTGIKRKEK
jgi:two-component system, sensor histidine kinase PdtaS